MFDKTWSRNSSKSQTTSKVIISFGTGSHLKNIIRAWLCSRREADEYIKARPCSCLMAR